MDTAGLCILVVDDNPDYLQAVSGLLSTYPCVGTILHAATALEGLEKARPTLLIGSPPVPGDLSPRDPDLVLLDIALPDGNGLDVTRQIKVTNRPPRVIVVTLYDTPAYRAAAVAVGADAFLAKSDLGESLQSVITDLFPDLCVPAAEGKEDSHTKNGEATDGDNTTSHLLEREQGMGKQALLACG